jgi:hypothetical protein
MRVSEVTHPLESEDRRRSEDTKQSERRESETCFLERVERRRSEDMQRKRLSERRVLTNYRTQNDGQVRTRKESERAWSTHRLENRERQTGDDTEKRTIGAWLKYSRHRFLMGIDGLTET